MSSNGRGARGACAQPPAASSFSGPDAPGATGSSSLPGFEASLSWSSVLSSSFALGSSHGALSRSPLSGHSSLQSGVPSLSMSVSATPQPQVPGSNLSASSGQPSLQSNDPSPSLSVSETPQPHVPGESFSGSSGQISISLQRLQLPSKQELCAPQGSPLGGNRGPLGPLKEKHWFAETPRQKTAPHGFVAIAPSHCSS